MKSCDHDNIERNEEMETEGNGWSTQRSIALEDALFRAGQTTCDFLIPHWAGDSGDVSPEQKRENEASQQTDYPRFVSVFRTNLGDEVYVISYPADNWTEIRLAREYNAREDIRSDEKLTVVWKSDWASHQTIKVRAMIGRSPRGFHTCLTIVENHREQNTPWGPSDPTMKTAIELAKIRLHAYLDTRRDKGGAR